MDRNQAVNFLKDLLRNCNDMSPEVLSFENSQTPECEGYCVRIKGPIIEIDKKTIREIAKKHNLTVKEGKGEVLISTAKGTA